MALKLLFRPEGAGEMSTIDYWATIPAQPAQRYNTSHTSLLLSQEDSHG